MAKKTALAGKPPRKRSTKKRASTARVKAPAALVPVPPTRIELLPPPVTDLVDIDERAIEGDDIMLGNLGLTTVEFTEPEETVLNEDVPLARVRFLPQQVPVLYLPWQEYVRLFNRALGRGKWSMVPIGRPTFDGQKRCIVQPFVLHIKGVPVAAAWGQQEYHESNKDQTFGDAVESTVASAMRRCAKRLGVWLELYDPDWKDRMVRELGACVTVKKRDGSEAKQWRRKDDPPFYNEQGGGRQRPPKPEPPAQTRPTDNPDGELPIGDLAAKQLWLRVRKMGRPDHEVSVWLAARYNVKATQEVKRKDFDAIMRAIEAPGPLPMPADRTPGEEG
jgi:hypothetical protein